MPFLAALLLACLVAANYLLHHDLMYPGLMQASLWLGAVLLFLFTKEMFIPVPDRVFALIVGGVGVFGMGAFCGSYRHRPYLGRTYVLPGTLPKRSAVLLLAGVVLVGLVLYVRRASMLATSGPFGSAFINLRYAVSINQEETGGFGLVAYFTPLAYVLAGILLLRRVGLEAPQASRLAVGLSLVVGVVFGALSSGRGILLPLLVIALAIPAVLRVTRPLKTLILLTLATLVIFAAGAITLEKGGSITRSLRENLTSMGETLVTYSVGSIPALGVFLSNQPREALGGVSSLRSVLAAAHALGFEVKPAPLVQPYIDVPMPTNVYTVYQPYAQDLGSVGALLMLFALGFIHATLYRKATIRRPHAGYVFLFSLSLFPLAMQIFQDMYFSLLSLWVQYATYAVFFFALLGERHAGALPDDSPSTARPERQGA